MQTFAWAKMALTFARHDTLADSLKKTFDGKHPCNVCKGISELLANSPQMNQAHLDGKVKALQSFSAAHRLIAERESYSYPTQRTSGDQSLSVSPPVPPPRQA